MPASEWAKTASDQDVVDYTRELALAVLAESCPTCAPDAGRMQAAALIWGSWADYPR